METRCTLVFLVQYRNKSVKPSYRRRACTTVDVKKVYCDRNVTISEPNHSRQAITKSLGKDTPSTVVFKGDVEISLSAFGAFGIKKSKE
jgi:hypothetical protein